MPKYKMGQAIRVKEDRLTKTKMGVVIGIKVEENKDENSGAITTRYVYNLSGHSEWFYEQFLIPMVELVREVKEEKPVA